jgi:hypothetical protein
VQLDFNRRLLGDREWFRQLAARARARAREIGKHLSLKVIEADTGYAQSTLSQGFDGENGRDVPLGLLPYLAANDPRRELGNEIARFWGCELRPLPQHTPLAQKLIEELEQFGTLGRDAIERAIKTVRAEE